MKVKVEEKEEGYDVTVEGGEEVDVFTISKYMLDETPIDLLISMVVNRTITAMSSINK